jgi:hypothetical protein
VVHLVFAVREEALADSAPVLNEVLLANGAVFISGINEDAGGFKDFDTGGIVICEDLS